MTPRDEATDRQVLAAEPRASTWVSANAGSGKTRVLTDRVARLLLGGVAPEKILCLTYTKAAASEMQNRLFRRLGAWAMLPDTALTAELDKLGETPPDGPSGLREARRLFARAIEAPGGLKIQTIHAFCAALLRRFPLEAGVSPDFAEMDDRAQRLLVEEIVDDMADGPEAPLVVALARQHPGDDLAALAQEVIQNRRRFDPSRNLGDWLAHFGLDRDCSEASLLSEVFLGGEDRVIGRLVQAMAAGSSNDVKAADKLRQIDLTLPGLETLKDLEDLFLTGGNAAQPFSAKIGAFPTKATRTGPAAGIMPEVEALMLRVEAARPKRCAFQAAVKAHALHAFAGPFLARYAQRKQARGWLDFDDLILLASDLLNREGVAQWVLFRLDGGIDHILVDEAQDTSPEQWAVIRRIAEEFSVGESARSDVRRTLFVVGDLKQSIYSFQGAEPANFERMAGHFATRLSEVGDSLERVDLPWSFRSAPAILRVVDEVFAPGHRHKGLGGPPVHLGFHQDMPGRVDLWPIVEKDAGEAEDPDWTDPVDRVDPAHHDIRLARKIAAEIARLCADEDATLPLRPRDGAPARRRLAPGDFLILVRRRSTLFGELIRACKAAGLPIAGADRLKLGGELAVRDLAALLSFLATPEDDLSLAAALKSPLFGWTEDRLFRLAHGRGDRYLWEVLRERGSAESETLSVLNDLRQDADFLRPFELLERILTRHDGRRRLLARLGPEAEDGIDALLGQALAYERTDVPSLTGFLTWMETDDVEVKRQLDNAGDMVRVMTVHGAKGLEAPVVILPETRPYTPRDKGQVLVPPEGLALWRSSADDAPPELARALDARRQRQAEEDMRLLYVAMTRAESWLIVAGSGDMGKAGDGWYNAVAQAMDRLRATPIDTPTGRGLRHEDGAAWDAGALARPDGKMGGKVPLPDWALKKAEPPVSRPEPVSPSDLGGAKALHGDATGLDEAAAKRRGRRLHRLFEHLPGLPVLQRDSAGLALLGSGDDPTDGPEAQELLKEALAVIDDPAVAGIFAADALVEVEIACDLAELGGRKVMGAIDRLIVAPDLVHAIDYKTNALVPARPEDVPEGILRQMAAYRAALTSLYPGRKTRVSILWTAGPVLMPLPAGLLDAALAHVSLP